MEILLGIVLFVVLLFFWLAGHWFARVLMFLTLGAGLGFYGWIVCSDIGYRNVGFAAGVGAAWLIASLPHFIYRLNRYHGPA